MNIPETGVSVSYLDYVVLDADGQPTKEDSLESVQNPWGEGGTFENPMDRGNDSAQMVQQMGMKLFVKAIEKEVHKIDCLPSENPAIQIQKHISNQVLDQLLELSQINKDSMSAHFPTGFDIQLMGDLHSDKRKVISRILSSANMVASKGRRGPANFIMIGKEYIDYLRQDISEDMPFQSMDEIGTMAYGMNIFVSANLGNTVIVGRTPKDGTEPGLHLVSTPEDISGVIKIANNDISGVDVTYMLVQLGFNPERNYLQFNILDHVD